MSTASQPGTFLNGSSPPNFATLTARDLEIFRALRIPDAAIAAAAIVRVSDREARDRFGIRGWKTSDMSGLIFPYLVPETGNRSTCRLRRDHPEVDFDGKPQGKYMTPAGDPRRLYYPPTVTLALLEDRSIPVVLVEAEKSALALMAFSARTKRYILALATGGCWGWMGRVGKRRNEHGQAVDVKDALFDFHYLTGRVVYVLLDANVATNPEVQRAEKRLVNKLRQWEVARVHVCRLPLVDGVNGPDDYLGKFRDESMSAVLDYDVKPIYKSNGAISAAVAGAAPIERLPEDTEIKMAHRFIQNGGGNLRHIPQLGSWRVWEGKRWREDDICEVWTQIHDFIAEAGSRMLETPSTCRHIASASTVAAIERISRWNLAAKLSIEQWDADACLLNTFGKTVEVENAMTIREARRHDHCTKSTSVQPDPHCEIPRWRTFLDTVTAGDKELQVYLQRMAGYCSTGLTREQVFFFLYGPGGNGKGVFVRTLAGILSDYAITTPSETFLETRNERHPTELARLRGARLILAGEPEEGRRWNEGLIKKFTGGEPIEARFMRGDFFDYMPQGKLIFSGNHRPGLKSVNEAIRRRLHLVPFSVIIPAVARDLKLEEKLRHEWPGILHWMLEGCIAWQREGLNPPKAVIDASADYLATEDVFGRFLEENCDISNPKAWEFSSRIWNRYKAWTEAANEYTGTQKDFATKLRQRFTRERNSQGVFYKGIALIDPAPV